MYFVMEGDPSVNLTCLLSSTRNLRFSCGAVTDQLVLSWHGARW